MRGKPNRCHAAGRRPGSIPARAGETPWARFGQLPNRVYPRPCGGNGTPWEQAKHLTGLSPPVRGKLPAHRIYHLLRGAIPARAGETRSHLKTCIETWVYPRPCGGNCGEIAERPFIGGLSPPVRGKPRILRLGTGLSGSIPARAGETLSSSIIPPSIEVYPRPCGGNVMPRPHFIASQGLSPPVRGKPAIQPETEKGVGSIPARAGETDSHCSPRRLSRVYPRPCGGNTGFRLKHRAYSGLSPPVRGKPSAFRPAAGPSGSIPARAGETDEYVERNRSLMVYPRPCGGNPSGTLSGHFETGLSPPVRGKQGTTVSAGRAVGSIPARAGETVARIHHPDWPGVYPRPCGGNQKAHRS